MPSHRGGNGIVGLEAAVGMERCDKMDASVARLPAAGRRLAETGRFV